MNRRQVESLVFSPARPADDSHPLHSRQAWRIDVGGEEDDMRKDEDIKARRKERLREAKRQTMLENAAKMRRRKMRQELFDLRKNKIRRELEARRRQEAESRKQKEAEMEAKRREDEQKKLEEAEQERRRQEAARAEKERKTKLEMGELQEQEDADKSLAQTLASTEASKQEETEVFHSSADVSYAEEDVEESLDSDEETVTHESDRQEGYAISSDEEEIADASESADIVVYVGDGDEDVVEEIVEEVVDEEAGVVNGDEEAIFSDDVEEEIIEYEVDGVVVEEEVVEEEVVEEEVMEEVVMLHSAPEQSIEQPIEDAEPIKKLEQEAALRRSIEEQNELVQEMILDDEDFLSGDNARLEAEEQELERVKEEQKRLDEERCIEEAEEMRREEEELLAEAEARRLEEEEELQWEEEELEREAEARRQGEEEERKQVLAGLLTARPSPKTMKKRREEDNVLSKEIGYRSPTVLALVSKAKLELRPPPPKEHKKEYVPVVLDAASIGRLVRLEEGITEAQGLRDVDELKKTDASYLEWEETHSKRGDKRKPVIARTRTNTQIIVNEAAAVGRMKGIRQSEVKNYEEGAKTRPRLVDIDDMRDEKHDGAKVIRTEHLINRQLTNKRKSTIDWTPDYDHDEYQLLDDVSLPTDDLPKFKRTESKRTHGENMEQLSQAVAEGYWLRYDRLERPGATLRVTPGCYCKYCQTANAWQTYAYQKKWADQHLPPEEELGEEPDPEKFGYLARLYLPAAEEPEEPVPEEVPAPPSISPTAMALETDNVAVDDRRQDSQGEDGILQSPVNQFHDVATAEVGALGTTRITPEDGDPANGGHSEALEPTSSLSEAQEGGPGEQPRSADDAVGQKTASVESPPSASSDMNAKAASNEVIGSGQPLGDQPQEYAQSSGAEAPQGSLPKKVETAASSEPVDKKKKKRFRLLKWVMKAAGAKPKGEQKQDKDKASSPAVTQQQVPTTSAAPAETPTTSTVVAPGAPVRDETSGAAESSAQQQATLDQSPGDENLPPTPGKEDIAASTPIPAVAASVADETLALQEQASEEQVTSMAGEPKQDSKDQVTREAEVEEPKQDVEDKIATEAEAEKPKQDSNDQVTPEAKVEEPKQDIEDQIAPEEETEEPKQDSKDQVTPEAMVEEPKQDVEDQIAPEAEEPKHGSKDEGTLKSRLTVLGELKALATPKEQTTDPVPTVDASPGESSQGKGGGGDITSGTNTVDSAKEAQSAAGPPSGFSDEETNQSRQKLFGEVRAFRKGDDVEIAATSQDSPADNDLDAQQPSDASPSTAIQPQHATSAELDRSSKSESAKKQDQGSSPPQTSPKAMQARQQLFGELQALRKPVDTEGPVSGQKEPTSIAPVHASKGEVAKEGVQQPHPPLAEPASLQARQQLFGELRAHRKSVDAEGKMMDQQESTNTATAHASKGESATAQEREPQSRQVDPAALQKRQQLFGELRAHRKPVEKKGAVSDHTAPDHASEGEVAKEREQEPQPQQADPAALQTRQQLFGELRAHHGPVGEEGPVIHQKEPTSTVTDRAFMGDLAKEEEQESQSSQVDPRALHARQQLFGELRAHSQPEGTEEPVLDQEESATTAPEHGSKSNPKVEGQEEESPTRHIDMGGGVSTGSNTPEKTAHAEPTTEGSSSANTKIGSDSGEHGTLKSRLSLLGELRSLREGNAQTTSTDQPPVASNGKLVPNTSSPDKAEVAMGAQVNPGDLKANNGSEAETATVVADLGSSGDKESQDEGIAVATSSSGTTDRSDAGSNNQLKSKLKLLRALSSKGGAVDSTTPPGRANDDEVAGGPNQGMAGPLPHSAGTVETEVTTAPQATVASTSLPVVQESTAKEEEVGGRDKVVVAETDDPVHSTPSKTNEKRTAKKDEPQQKPRRFRPLKWMMRAAGSKSKDMKSASPKKTSPANGTGHPAASAAAVTEEPVQQVPSFPPQAGSAAIEEAPPAKTTPPMQYTEDESAPTPEVNGTQTKSISSDVQTLNEGESSAAPELNAMEAKDFSTSIEMQQPPDPSHPLESDGGTTARGRPELDASVADIVEEGAPQSNQMDDSTEAEVAGLNVALEAETMANSEGGPVSTSTGNDTAQEVTQVVEAPQTQGVPAKEDAPIADSQVEGVQDQEPMPSPSRGDSKILKAKQKLFENKVAMVPVDSIDDTPVLEGRGEEVPTMDSQARPAGKQEVSKDKTLPRGEVLGPGAEAQKTMVKGQPRASPPNLTGFSGFRAGKSVFEKAEEKSISSQSRGGNSTASKKQQRWKREIENQKKWKREMEEMASTRKRDNDDSSQPSTYAFHASVSTLESDATGMLKTPPLKRVGGTTAKKEAAAKTKTPILVSVVRPQKKSEPVLTPSPSLHGAHHIQYVSPPGAMDPTNQVDATATLLKRPTAVNTSVDNTTQTRRDLVQASVPSKATQTAEASPKKLDAKNTMRENFSFQAKSPLRNTPDKKAVTGVRAPSRTPVATPAAKKSGRGLPETSLGEKNSPHQKPASQPTGAPKRPPITVNVVKPRAPAKKDVPKPASKWGVVDTDTAQMRGYK